MGRSYGQRYRWTLLGDYTLVNIKLDWRPGGGPVSLYLGMDNLFDEEYQESFDLPRPGQFVYAGLRAGF